MNKDVEQYINDSCFLEFLNREFESTAANATIEELATFAFGGIDKAVEIFRTKILPKNED